MVAPDSPQSTNEQSRQVSELGLKIAADDGFTWGVKGLYVDDLERLPDHRIDATHPRLVGAIIPDSHDCYIEWLLERNPEVGAAIVYGTVVLRTEPYINKLLDASREVMARVDSRSPCARLLRYAICLAAKTGCTLDENATTVLHARVKEIEGIFGVPSSNASQIEVAGSDLSTLKRIVDQIAVSSKHGQSSGDIFDVSCEPTLVSYFMAIFGAMSAEDTLLRRAAIEFLHKLDSELFSALEWGIVRGWFWNRFT